MISTSLEPFPNQHGVFLEAPTKIPCPIEIWMSRKHAIVQFLLRSRASLVSLGTENRTLCSTRFVIPEIAWTRQWTGNGQAIRCSCHQKCGKLPPTILFFNRFRHYSTRQRCRGNFLTLKSPMKEPPDSSCWQIN